MFTRNRFLRLLRLPLFIALVILVSPNFAQENNPTSPSLGKEKQLTSIPFVQDSSTSLIVVSVQVNGHNPMPFIVDTGLASPIIIEKWAADQLKLVPSKDHITFLPGSQTFPVAMLKSILLKANGTAPDIDFGSLPAGIVDFDVPSSSTAHIAGTLGMPMFLKLVMQVNFRQHVINLSEQLDHSQLGSNAVLLPLTQPDPETARFFTVWPLRSSAQEDNSSKKAQKHQECTQLPAGRGNLLVDTGSNSSSFPDAVISSLHPTSMSIGTRLNFAGVSENNFAVLPEVAIGGFTITNLSAASLPSQKKPLLQPEIGSEPTIGMDILQHFEVTFDFPHKQMILDRFDNKTAASTNGTTGIQLIKQKQGFFIGHISPHSPAAKAFMHIGDKVIQIDELDLASCSVEAAQQDLDGNVGTGAHLLVVSIGSKPRQLTLPRLSLYDPSLYPSLGFFVVRRLSDQAILVDDILCSSPAWKAGVRVGDVLTAVNGTPVKTGPRARSLLNAWPKKSLTLAIQRDGKPLFVSIK